MKLSLVLPFLLLPAMSLGQNRPAIPGDLLDDEQFRSESGLNEFTVPSIAKIFDELEKVSPLTYQSEHLKNHERLPLDRSRLALRLGTLIADGFIAVQTGNSQDVEAISQHLSRYAKALGAGDRIKKHAAALLEHAKAKDLNKLKLALAATQRDVERELVGLRDPDLSHLISLGGWLQALDSAAQAVNQKFTPERAATLFREDIADYYAESLGSLHPTLSQQKHMVEMRELLHGLRTSMALEEEAKPTAKEVTEVTEISAKLIKIARN